VFFFFFTQKRIFTKNCYNKEPDKIKTETAVWGTGQAIS